MGGSSKKVTVGYKYYLGMHMILCHGPVDSIRDIKVDGRVAWQGDYAGGRINIHADNLFGGTKREGGISGAVDFEPGHSTQVRNDYLQSMLGSTIPAFRGVVGLVLRQCYLGINPYLKRWSARLQRIHVRRDGVAQWYDAKAKISHAKPIQFTSTVSCDSLEGFSLSGVPGAILSDGSVIYNPANQADNDTKAVAPLNVPLALESFSFSFRVTARNEGDPMRIALVDESGSSVFQFNPSSEVDSIRRATIHSHDNPIGSEAAVIGTWYRAKLDFSGEALMTIHNQSSGALFASLAVPGLSSKTVESLMFVRDGDSVEFNMPSTAEFDNVVLVGYQVTHDMNPAHIIRECLTDLDWGMGYQDADIDNESFTAAADQLYLENMGISILWDRQIPIEDFVTEIIRHINAALYVDRITGKFVLKLIRDDFDDGDLITLGEDEIDRVDGYSRPAFGEMVNSVTVNFWDSTTGKTASVTAQDTALIQLQGSVIGTTLQYPGFTNHRIATQVAMRNLQAMSFPLLSCTIYANRVAASLNIGDAFKFEWPDCHDGYIVMRVTGMALGDGRKNAVRITCMQDVFSLPETAAVSIPYDEWEDPSAPPTPSLYRVAVEAPYYELVQRLGQDDTDSKLTSNPDAGYILASAARPSGAINATLMVDAGAGYEDSGVVEFSPVAFLSADIGPGDTVIPITGGDGLAEIRIGSHAQIGDELVRIDAVASDELTVGRGVLDTVPTAHGSGAVLLAWDDFAEGDSTEYATGETLDVKLLPVSGAGSVELAAATADVLTLAQRAIRPYPPGRLLICGEAYPETIGGSQALTLAWAHRDRRLQTAGDLQDTTVGDIGPEAGTSYTVRVYKEDGDLLVEADGITGAAYSYSLEDEIADSGILTDLTSLGYADLTLALTPTAYWRLDEASGTSAADAVGSHPATHDNAPTVGVNGLIGASTKAVTYPGSSLVRTRVPTNLFPNSGATGARTIAFWFKTTTTTQMIVFDKLDGSSTNNRIFIGINRNHSGAQEAGKLNLFTRETATSNNFSFTTANSAIYDGNPHFAVVVVDGGNSRIYLDGVNVACSGSVATGQLHGGTGHSIGDVGAGSAVAFNGTLDEIVVFPRALTSSEVADLYAVRNDAASTQVYRQNGRLRIELESERDGLSSYQAHDYTVLREGYGFNYGQLYGGAE